MPPQGTARSLPDPMLKTRLMFLIVALAAVLWIACSGDDDPMAPPAGPTTVPDSVSFKNHIQPIFSARCAVSAGLTSSLCVAMLH